SPKTCLPVVVIVCVSKLPQETVPFDSPETTTNSLFRLTAPFAVSLMRPFPFASSTKPRFIVFSSAP
ncbi:Uncharacterized protein APZ42_007425, partial [Daphnia magna]